LQQGDCYTHQWEPYEVPKQNAGVSDAFGALHNFLHINKLMRLEGKTGIMLMPGYPYQVIQGLVTNFHQPKSTLMLLVAAFIGDDWRKIYTHALENNYRFLSYGDGSLLVP
jgi:S-adenosylmethionine:tRNA ribosyltransferase-isomerase